MSATVNEPGVKYGWAAQREAGNAFSLLGQAPSEAFERISEALCARVTAERGGQSYAIGGKAFADCVHKLEAVAYHLTRLHAHKEELLRRIRLAAQNAGSGTVAFLGRETVYEFEALVLQARATLDTTTWFLSRACGQRTWRFGKLRNVLSGGAPGDPRIQACLVRLEECPWMLSTKVLAGDPSTRSYVAHYGSLLSSQRTCFTASLTVPDAVLLFDAEMHDNVPVLTTASKIQEDVPFFVMATLSVFLDLPLPEKKAFASDLGSEFVVLSESGVPGDGMKVGVIKEMWSGGFTVGDVAVSRDILARAVKLCDLPA